MNELQKRFAEGDPAAFEALFHDHQREVYMWILRVVRDPAVAEDLTIETFWRAHRAASRFDAERSFGAWLRRIAMNVARKHLARQRPEVIVEDLGRYGTYVAEPEGERGATRRAIREAFTTLPEDMRMVALLALIEEVPYAEIGESLGLSLSAVKTRVFRAVHRLRDELRKRGIR